MRACVRACVCPSVCPPVTAAILSMKRDILSSKRHAWNLEGRRPGKLVKRTAAEVSCKKTTHKTKSVKHANKAIAEQQLLFLHPVSKSSRRQARIFIFIFIERRQSCATFADATGLKWCAYGFKMVRHHRPSVPQ